MYLFYLLYAASTFVTIMGSVWGVLYVLGRCLVFRKAGRAFWKALIPVWNEYTEYSISWLGVVGLINSVTYISYFVIYRLTEKSSYYTTISTSMIVVISVLAGASAAISIIQKIKLSRAFGHGILFSLGLVFLSPIFYLIIGLGKSEYLGNPSLGELY